MLHERIQYIFDFHLIPALLRDKLLFAIDEKGLLQNESINLSIASSLRIKLINVT